MTKTIAADDMRIDNPREVLKSYAEARGYKMSGDALGIEGTAVIPVADGEYQGLLIVGADEVDTLGVKTDIEDFVYFANQRR